MAIYVENDAQALSTAAQTLTDAQRQRARDNLDLAGMTSRGSLIEMGLSLVDQGYAPQWSSGGGVVRQITNANVLQHAIRRARVPYSIYYSAGKAGDTVTGTLARWNSDVLARLPLPGWVSYLNGGNDVNSISVEADIETTLAAMKADFETTLGLIYGIGAKLILQSLPDNGTWSARRDAATGNAASPYLRYHAYWRWNRYLMEIGRRYNCIFSHLASAYSRPERQIPVPATSITVTSNTATVVTASAHGYSTSDVVFNNTAGDFTWLVGNGVAITVVNPTTFTYPFTHANGTATIPGSFVRSNMITALFSDSPSLVHFNPAGALKGSHITYDAIKNGAKDVLVFSEGDAENLVGVGIAGVTGKDVLNRGMMMGTTGTKTGTAVSHTGTVATGYNSDVVSGNPTAVTLSLVTRTEPGRVQMQDQQIVIQAAAQNVEYRFRIAHTLPAAWSASAAKAVDAWVMPTVANGFFYVCVLAGTTSSTQPTWSTTPGALITDGTAKWECRRGWINNDSDKYRLGAEYTIVSLSAVDALMSLSFGLVNSANDTLSILDGNHVQNSVSPGYVAGETGFFSTPAATIPAAMTAPEVSMRCFVKANTTVTLNIGRASWYRDGLTI